MAPGSQQITWILLGGKRPCDCCGRDFKIDELGEYRMVDKKMLIWCENCRGGKPKLSEEERKKKFIELATSHPTPARKLSEWWEEFPEEKI